MTYLGMFIFLKSAREDQGTDARLNFDYLIIKLNLNKGGANYFMFISAATAVLPKDNRGINWSCNL